MTVIQKLLRKGAERAPRSSISWAMSDEFLDRFVGWLRKRVPFGKNRIIARRMVAGVLVMHGDELDAVVTNLGWLAHFGHFGYLALDALQRLRKLLPPSLGPRILVAKRLSVRRAEVKNVVGFMSHFEESVSSVTQKTSNVRVLCGHIHTPARN